MLFECFLGTFFLGLFRVRGDAGFDFLFGSREDTAEGELVDNAVFGAGGEFTFTRDDLSLSLVVLANSETFLTQIGEQDFLDLGEHSRI